LARVSRPSSRPQRLVEGNREKEKGKGKKKREEENADFK